jgi:tetratricopeptide (TPR) repeat protein
LHADPAGSLDVDNTRNLALSLTKTAVAFMNEGAYSEAEKLAVEAVALAEELASQPDALPDHRALFAEAHEAQGETLVGQERQAEGLVLYQKARRLRLALVAQFPSDPEFRRGLAGTHASIAGLHKDRGELDQARAELESALRLRHALAEEFPQNRTDAAALSEIERLLAELNRE